MNLQRASSVLEIVSYWNDTVLEVEHIHSGGFGEALSLHDEGYRFQLGPDMQALLKKSDGQAIEPQDSIIEVGRQDILHIKQGNLNFVFAYVNIPGVTLPRLTQRDGFAWLVLFFSFFLYCVAATVISLTEISERPEDDFKPWLELSKPITIELPPMPRPMVTPKPQAVVPKPQPPQPVPPKPIAAKPGRSMEPPAPPAASAPAGSKAPIGGLRNIPGLSSKLPTMDQSSIFKGPSGEAVGRGDSSRSGTQNLPGIGNNQTLGLDSAGNAANRVQGSGTSGIGSDGIGKTFGDGKGRAEVGIQGQDPVTGDGLHPSEVQAVVRTHLNEIRHCYEVFLQRMPGVAGRVKANFVIGSSGQVISAGIMENTLGDADLGNCISGKIERWKFPAPRNSSSVKVNYPFVFTPR